MVDNNSPRNTHTQTLKKKVKYHWFRGLLFLNIFTYYGILKEKYVS